MVKSVIELVKTAKSIINEISVQQANEMISNGSLILDVRELFEFKIGHIPNAHHISRGLLEFMIEDHADFQNKNASIIVYCKSGGRSALATQSLVQLGFTNVHSMLGGFEEWSSTASSTIEAVTS